MRWSDCYPELASDYSKIRKSYVEHGIYAGDGACVPLPYVIRGHGVDADYGVGIYIKREGKISAWCRDHERIVHLQWGLLIYASI